MRSSLSSKAVKRPGWPRRADVATKPVTLARGRAWAASRKSTSSPLMLSKGSRSRSSHSKATRRESARIVNQLRPSCSCIQIEIGNFRQLDCHFRGDISTGCPVAASAAVDIRQERLYTSFAILGTDQTTKDSAMATVHSALTDLLDPLGDCMTPEVARKVVQLRASAARGMRSSTSTAALPRETTRDRVRI